MKSKAQKTMKPIYEVQKEAHEKYLVNPRTFQWYVTKGLLPKGTKIGREAFYDVDDSKVNVYDYLAVVKLLQNLFNLGTDQIKELLRLYDGQLKILSALLRELAEKYPAGVPLVSANWALQKEFLDNISGEEAIDLKSVDLKIFARDARKKTSDLFDPLA